MMKRLVLAVSIVLAACGEDATVAPPGSADGGTSDGGSGVDPDGGSSGDASTGPWISVEPISDDGTVVAERVSYRSQGLRIYALHCRPKAPGKYKAYVFNHGGVSGIGGFDATHARKQ